VIKVLADMNEGLMTWQDVLTKFPLFELKGADTEWEKIYTNISFNFNIILILIFYFLYFNRYFYFNINKN